MLNTEDIAKGDLVRINYPHGDEYAIVLAVYRNSAYHSPPSADVCFSNGSQTTLWMWDITELVAKAKQ